MSGNVEAIAMIKALDALSATPVVVSKSKYRNSANVICVGVVIEEY